MSKYILKYRRDSRVKYISHLDFMRMFQRAVRRSGVEFLFSEGFNPHPVMTVAMPISVGVTSDGEYMKVGFADTFTPEEIMERINAAFPPGFEITEIHKLSGKEIDLSKISEAVYTVAVELEEGASPCDTEKALSQSSLVVMKKTKSGEKQSDIGPYIYELSELERGDGYCVFRMRLACSNAYNLKPETVISAMEKTDENFRVSFMTVHRNGLVLPS